MSTVTVSHGGRSGMTMVSNRFIDEYMRDANDTQVKIYLYLLRVAGTNLPSGISDIADYFNHTEKDVLRALKYWDKLHVLTLLYNDAQELHGIRLEDLESRPANAVPVTDSRSSVPITVSFSTQLAPSMDKPVQKQDSGSSEGFDKSSITLDQLKAFKNRNETSELLFIIEQYLGKPISANDVRSIFFMTDILHFSTDLIDYLVQYCVERGKKDFRYMEKVAISWSEEGITTPKQATSYVKKYDKNVYTIMNSLGKNAAPTAREMEFISRWLKEYGFSLDLIKEACQRSVMATDKHRFEYADRILQSWNQASVRTLKDVTTADEAFQRKKSNLAAAKTTVNAFNQFKQNQYDYDDLLQKIKVN